jgi:hypothetical protein
MSKNLCLAIGIKVLTLPNDRRKRRMGKVPYYG